MQGVMNELEFANPRRLKRWQLRAQGWRDMRSQHEGGMTNPLEIKLRRGQFMFRVGHSRSRRGPVPLEVNLSSPWWFEGETFADISISANSIDIDMKMLARLKLSVSERYGVFDTIFCVRLLGALGAFRGEGNPVFDPPDPESTNPPPVWAFPGRSIKQCFIPGLRDLHDRPSGLAEEAFSVIRTMPVHAWQSF